MNSKVIDILKEKPIVIPRTLFKNYKKMNVTEEELVILIFIINCGDKMIYNPEVFVQGLGMDKYRVMQLINDLSTKNIITIKVEKNAGGKMEEYIYADLFYTKLFNFILDSDEKVKEGSSIDIFTIFEQELGRTISPMEVEKIKEWLSDGINEELIREALKEAVYKNARSINYINSILYSWKQKGIRTPQEARQEKQKFRSAKKETVSVFDYNWLEDE